MKMTEKYEYRKMQGLLGETSFSLVMPKQFAVSLGIGKGDFVKVWLEGRRMLVEKA